MGMSRQKWELNWRKEREEKTMGEAGVSISYLVPILFLSIHSNYSGYSLY